MRPSPLFRDSGGSKMMKLNRLGQVCSPNVERRRRKYSVLCLCVRRISALSLAICFPGGPRGVSPASQGGPDSAGIWRTGPRWPVGLLSAAAVKSRLCFSLPRRFPPLFLCVCCFVSQDLFCGCHTFLTLSLSFMFPPPVLCAHPVQTRLGFRALSQPPSESHCRLYFHFSFAVSLTVFSRTGSLRWAGCPRGPVCCGSHMLGEIEQEGACETD